MVYKSAAAEGPHLLVHALTPKCWAGPLATMPEDMAKRASTAGFLGTFCGICGAIYHKVSHGNCIMYLSCVNNLLIFVDPLQCVANLPIKYISTLISMQFV